MSKKTQIPDDSRFDILRNIYTELKEQYGLSPSEILDVLEKKVQLIPVTVFNKQLSPLETVVKYLKENKGQSLTEIAKVTQRSTKTIWQAYQGSKKKQEAVLSPAETTHHIPVDILGHREFSILESVVVFMREQRELSLRQIAQVLQRNERTVWTVYNRAKKKRGGR